MEQVARAIGFLVYAVASADNHVSAEEKQKVHQIVNDNWQVLADAEDPFGVRAMEYIDKIMLGLDEQHVDSEKAFHSFEEVYQANLDKFTPALKSFIVKVCIETGSAFNRMNKSELVLISRIELLLKD
jgi:uncharacterized tellurite resistance protein B-like protein